MSAPGNQADERPESFIRLEAAESHPAVRPVEQPDSQPQGDPPVPAHPLHLCPNCGYNLTGLTSRRCPECGEPFTLSDARFAAFDVSEEAQEYRRWLWKDRGLLALGIFLLGLGLFCSCISRSRFSGSLQIYVSLKTVVMWMIAVPAILMTLLLNLYYQQSWSRPLLILGISLAAIGAIVALL